MNTQYVEMKISDIIIKDRLRDVQDDEYLEVLQENISQIGLIEPIIVDKNNVLIAGAHRLKASQNLGMETIKTLVQDIDVETNEDAKIIEVCENLIRKNLSNKEIVAQYKILASYYKSKGVSNPADKMSSENGKTVRMNNIMIRLGDFVSDRKIYDKLPNDITITTLIELSKSENRHIVEEIKEKPVPSTVNEIKNALKANQQFNSKPFSNSSSETTELRQRLEEQKKETTKVVEEQPKPKEEVGGVKEVEGKYVVELSEEEQFTTLKNKVNNYLIDICEEVNTTISKNELNRILNDIKSKCDEFLRS